MTSLRFIYGGVRREMHGLYSTATPVLFGACSAPALCSAPRSAPRRLRRQRSAPSAPSAPASPFGARPHFYWFSQWFLQASTDASWTGFGILWAQVGLFWGPQVNVADTDSIARFRRNSTGYTGPVQKDAHLIADGIIHQCSSDTMHEMKYLFVFVGTTLMLG